MKEFVCKCGNKEVFIKDKGTQKGLYCANCGKWIKWLGKEEHRLAVLYIDEYKKNNSTYSPIKDNEIKPQLNNSKDGKKNVTIYTDGSCSGNPGQGGWACVLIYGQIEKQVSGGEAHTTNNRMELMSAIQGLMMLKEPCCVTLISDSKYLIDAFEKGWLKSWQKNNWIKANKDPVLNDDLWKQLCNLTEKHDVKFQWTKGHANDKYNEICDKLAVSETSKYKNTPF